MSPSTQKQGSGQSGQTRQGGPQGGGDRPNQASEAIDSLRSAGFYADGRVRPELFDQTARKLGRAFADRATRVSSNQMRAFYGDAKAVEMKLLEMTRATGQATTTTTNAIDESIFHEHEYLVRLLGPKVNYIQGKQTGQNVAREFRDFIEAGLAHVKSAADFQVFMRLFESVVGYFYGFGGGNQR